MAKKFEVSASRKARLIKATQLMSAGLINYLFTEVLIKLMHKNFTSYGAAMHYLEEKMSHLSNERLEDMWASWFDRTKAQLLYKELWLLAGDLHRTKSTKEEIFEWVNSTHHLHNIGGLLKQPKQK